MPRCRGCGAPHIFGIVPICQVCLSATMRAFEAMVARICAECAVPDTDHD